MTEKYNGDDYKKNHTGAISYLNCIYGQDRCKKIEDTDEYKTEIEKIEKSGILESIQKDLKQFEKDMYRNNEDHCNKATYKYKSMGPDAKITATYDMDFDSLIISTIDETTEYEHAGIDDAIDILYGLIMDDYAEYIGMPDEKNKSEKSKDNSTEANFHIDEEQSEVKNKITDTDVFNEMSEKLGKDVQQATKIREVPLAFEEMEQADELWKNKQNDLYSSKKEDSPAE